MSDWSFPPEPSGGWLAAMLVLAGAVGSALNVPLQWLLGYFGWRKTQAQKLEAARVQGMHELVDKRVAVAVEKAMSPVRQQLADEKRGLDGKQAHLESRLNQIGEEMRERDDRLSSSLHRRMTAEFSEHEGRLTKYFDKGIERIEKHFTHVLNVALNGRRRD